MKIDCEDGCCAKYANNSTHTTHICACVVFNTQYDHTEVFCNPRILGEGESLKKISDIFLDKSKPSISISCK